MKSIWKWIIGIVLLLIIAVLAIGWHFSRNWKPLIAEKLQETVTTATDGLYSLRYDDLYLNVTLGNATLQHAELIPDSAVYRQMVENQTAPNSRYHIKVVNLKVERFNIWDILKNRTLFIRKITFESPDIHMISERHAFNDTLRTDNSGTLYDNIRNVFSAINVRDIEVDNVHFKLSRIEENRSSDLVLDSVGIQVHDVLLDEASVHDTTRLFYTKRVEVIIPGFEYETSDGFYKASFDRLVLNTQEENVLLTQVRYAPKMDKSTYFKARNENKTMIDMQFDTLRFQKLNFQELIDNQQTIAQIAQVKNGSISLYNDKRYPKKVSSKIGQSPHQQLLKLKQLIRIDTIQVDQVDVLYGEHSAKYNRSGSITFEKAKGIVTNVTNDHTVLERDSIMRADLQAQIMGAGRLQIAFGFDMRSANGYHTYKGSLGRMQATAFNRILQPLLNVEIGSGNIRSIHFNMQGNDRRNWGQFRFEYDHLKLNLLAPPGQEMNKAKKGVLSFVVNNVLINDSNPDANGVHHIGQINYRRVAEHTFFKTLWESLLEGIKQCAGISKEREAKLLNTAETAKKATEETKEKKKKTGRFFKNLFKKDDKQEQ